jgi:hypothetical protein
MGFFGTLFSKTGVLIAFYLIAGVREARDQRSAQ